MSLLMPDITGSQDHIPAFQYFFVQSLFHGAPLVGEPLSTRRYKGNISADLTRTGIDSLLTANDQARLHIDVPSRHHAAGQPSIVDLTTFWIYPAD